jgi:flagellar biosynthesis/type III secretory pathway M-ring protein FliF/YscJ
MNWLRHIKAYALGALGLLVAIKTALMFRSQRDEAQRQRDGERQAREAVTDTHRRTREITDDIRLVDPDGRRERLRKYAARPDRDD